jgi:hypothetical protein
MTRTGETERRHSKWGRVSYGNSNVVITACSARDFQVRKFQAIHLSTICLYKQRLGRHLTIAFFMFWGISRVWKWAEIRKFWCNMPPPLGPIKYISCRTRSHVHNQPLHFTPCESAAMEFVIRRANCTAVKSYLLV